MLHHQQLPATASALDRSGRTTIIPGTEVEPVPLLSWFHLTFYLSNGSLRKYNAGLKYPHAHGGTPNYSTPAISISYALARNPVTNEVFVVVLEQRSQNSLYA